MINQKRRTVLKSLSMLAALPVVGLSSFASAQGVTSHQQQTVAKSAITVSNLTGKTVTLNKISPIDSTAINRSVSFSVAGVGNRTLMPGGSLTFDVVSTGESAADAVIDQIEIKSDRSEFDGILSVTSGHAQISQV